MKLEKIRKEQPNVRSSFKPKLIVCRVGNLYTTVRITQVLLVGNFWVQKKGHRNISLWDLVLKISSRPIQPWKRIINQINGFTYKTFLSFKFLHLILVTWAFVFSSTASGNFPTHATLVVALSWFKPLQIMF